MIHLIIRALDWYIQRDSLRSQLRCLRVPSWPWDRARTLRKRLDWAAEYGYPSSGAERQWLSSHEGRMAMFELELMRAVGVAK